MDTATQPGAPSASAYSARADGTSAVTATEHDHHMDSATEPAPPLPVPSLLEPMVEDPTDNAMEVAAAKASVSSARADLATVPPVSQRCTR